MTPKGKDYLKKNQKSKPEGIKSEEGFVYYVQEGGIDGNITIGHSKDPAYRLTKHQRGNSKILRMLVCVKGSSKDEKKIHKKFKDFNIDGEWFKPDLKLLKHIEQEKSKFFETTLNLLDDHEKLRSRIKGLDDR